MLQNLRTHPLLLLAAYILGGIWITGGMSFYILRFLAALYHENQSAVDKLLRQLF